MKLAALLLAASSCATAQFGPFKVKPVPPVNLQNSSRLESLIRAGSLYLSLPDAIALALENNLDIEFERFAPQIAGTDTLRAKGGGTLRGISLNVREIPPGIGGPASPLINAAASGNISGSTLQTSSLLTALTPTVSAISITGASQFSSGPPIPAFDPAITANLQFQHSNTPESNPIVTGTNALVGNSWSGAVGAQQGFSTGTMVNVSLDASRSENNSRTSLLNPSTTSSLGVSLVQPLLRGFGVEMNRRFIRIARNNEKTTDQVFRQQLIATVSGVIRLYDDLVSLLEDVKVKQQTLTLAQRLYEDNRVQVEQGTLAPVELTRAQAQVAAARQDLANSQGFAHQQELIVKTLLSRRGTSDPLLRSAAVVPTTPLEVPAVEPVRPVDDLVNDALHSRPEMEEARLQIQNSHISLSGSRNELLPQLDLVATAQNAGLAGGANPGYSSTGSQTFTAPGNSIGGLGGGLEQSFSFRYPSYTIGVQLTLPVRNRIAIADVTRDELQVKQFEVSYQQLQNSIRLEVEAAAIALEQARTALDAAVEARTLQEQSLTIEQEKLAAGLSTTFLVLQYQSFVAQARSTEVAARGVYAKSQTSLERALGRTLDDYNINLSDVFKRR